MEERRERELEMGAMTLNRTIQSITTLRVKDLYVTLNIRNCHYSAIMLNVIMLSVVMMSVVAPRN
jgi:hypothetical protein